MGSGIKSGKNRYEQKTKLRRADEKEAVIHGNGLMELSAEDKKTGEIPFQQGAEGRRSSGRLTKTTGKIA